MICHYATREDQSSDAASVTGTPRFAGCRRRLGRSQGRQLAVSGYRLGGPVMLREIRQADVERNTASSYCLGASAVSTGASHPIQMRDSQTQSQWSAFAS